MPRGAGERGPEPVRPRAERNWQLDDVRATGHGAYLDHDRDVAVLDLAFDSLVTTHGPRSPVRRLRFAGHECTLDVEVRGETLLTVDLRVSPAGLVMFESHAPGASEPLTILSSRGHAVTWMHSQLTTFVVRWPTTTRAPIRSAWVLL